MKEDVKAASMTLEEANELLTSPGQMFEIEDLDIFGVTTRTWKQAPQSLRVVLDLSLGHGGKDFIVYEDDRISFKQHYRRASTLSHRLIDEFGVGQGDRVTIAMRNLPEWIMAFWAITVAGAVAVPLNAWWTGEELAYGISDSGSVLAFVDVDRLDRISPYEGDMPTLRTLVVATEDRATNEPVGPGSIRTVSFDDALGKVDESAVPPDIEILPEQDATIFYTSGTTGRPKGAVGTHRNTCTNLMNLFYINTRSVMRYGSGLVDESEGAQSAYLLTVPLFHATGCHAVMITNTAAGGKIVLMHHFDPIRALELIERERITTFGGVPTMVMQVLDVPNFESFDVSSVRSVSYGGAPAPKELVKRIGKHFPIGQPGNGYGLTETSAVTSMNTGQDYIDKPDSVGPPMPVTEIAVVPDDFEGQEPTLELPRGKDVIGELWIKGPQVVRGYWNRPEETAQSFSKGWLHTGDIARIDDEGYIIIVDRAKDMVIRGGENVYCVEVEDALFAVPGIQDCAVIGVPHPVLGEEVGCVIVQRTNADLSLDFIRDQLVTKLAKFMIPTHLFISAEPLPRNPQGKVLKNVLRQEFLKE